MTLSPSAIALLEGRENLVLLILTCCIQKDFRDGTGSLAGPRGAGWVICVRTP